MQSAINPKVNADGRSLSDFHLEDGQTPLGLRVAEKKLLESVAKGDECEISKNRPFESSDQNVVRGAFVRFLLLNNDLKTPVHEKGVLLKGAHILGDIDLECIKTRRPLELINCHIDGNINASDAELHRIRLDGSCVQRIAAPNVKVTGDVTLGGGFVSERGVHFTGAQIGGNLDCRDGRFDAQDGHALSCAQAQIRRSVFLGEGFVANALVNFFGADVGGDFHCAGGTFRHCVARVGDKWRDAAYALHLGGAKIRSTLWLGHALHLTGRPVSIQGSLNLKDMQTERFRTDPTSWPSPHIITEDGEKLVCVIEIDGFVYDRLGGGALADAQTCKQWLLRQPAEHLSASFRPQPFEQLAKVLRAMGHTQDAREVGYYKEFLNSRRPWQNELRKYNPFAWIWWLLQILLLEKALGYGYRPHRMVILAVAVMLFCGFIFSIASNHGIFVPTNARIFLDQQLKQTCSPIAGAPDWTDDKCQLRTNVPEYTPFNL